VRAFLGQGAAGTPGEPAGGVGAHRGTGFLWPLAGFRARRGVGVQGWKGSRSRVDDRPCMASADWVPSMSQTCFPPSPSPCGGWVAAAPGQHSPFISTPYVPLPRPSPEDHAALGRPPRSHP
jgi:hypothetical protein